MIWMAQLVSKKNIYVAPSIYVLSTWKTHGNTYLKHRLSANELVETEENQVEVGCKGGMIALDLTEVTWSVIILSEKGELLNEMEGKMATVVVKDCYDNRLYIRN